MTPLRSAVELHMRLRGFSPRTHESYIHAIRELALFYDSDPSGFTCGDVQFFLDHLITNRKLAWATINVYFSAYRMLYEHILHRSKLAFSIPPRGRSGKRPGILSREEVLRLIYALSNLKHRALLMMTYGSGLRVSEVVRLEPKHIDRGRMMVHVEDGKGHKDRYTVLSAKALTLLEDHWRTNRPSQLFFYGRDRAQPMSIASAQHIYHHAVKSSGVRMVGGIHTLRHCFATHLMEAGTDIYTIRRWLGHTSLVTTGRYMHVTAEHLAKVKSPLDSLYEAP